MFGSEHQTLFVVGFVIYICLMILVGWLTTRKHSAGSNYLTGGRALPLFLVLATTSATMIGTGSSMGQTAEGFRSGFGAMFYGIGGPLALILLAVCFSNLRDKNFITMAEEAQYYFGGSTAVRKVTAILMYVAEVTWIGSHMNGGSKYLQFVTGMDTLTAKIITLLAFTIYVFIGGYLAVVWTDAVQLIIVLAGFGLILLKIFPMVGGWENIYATYEAAGNPTAITFLGLGNTGFMAAISLTVVGIISEFATPTFRTRIYTSKDSQTARKSFILTALVVLGFSAIPSIMGMSAFTLATNNNVTMVLENPDYAFSYIATQVLGPTLGLVLLIAGLSATMSSGDSDAIAGTTALIEDIYPQFTGRHFNERNIKKASRIGLLITMAFAFCLALGASDVMGYISNVLGSIFPGLAITLFIGRFWTKRVTPAAGVASMITGTAFGVLVLLIPSLKDFLSSAFGGPVIPVSLLTAAVCIVVSLCTKRPALSEQEILDIVLEGRSDLEEPATEPAKI